MITKEDYREVALRLVPGILILAALHPLGPVAAFLYRAGLRGAATYGSILEIVADLAIDAVAILLLYVWAVRTLAGLNAESRQALDRVAASEARFRGLVEALPIGISLGEKNGRVFEANQACADMHMVPRDVLVSPATDWHRFVPADKQPLFEKAGKELDESGRCEPFETEILRSDGSRLPVLMGIKCLDCSLAACYFENLTALKQREAAVKRAAELEEGRRVALEASFQKNKFLAEMSHELRTPLNAILGFAEVLRQGRAGAVAERQAEYLGYILASASHLRNLIEDVLDLSQIESGRLALRLEPADPAELVAEVCEVLHPAARAKGIDIRIDVGEEPPTITTDVSRFKQILLNLASNAIKFTPEKRWIAVRLDSAGPNEFRMEVEDSGIGIDQADLGRLFKEFERLDSSQVGSPPGSGLGLAVTRHIVDEMGGRIEVHSELGKGSTFTAYLPVRPHLSPEPHPSHSGEVTLAG